MKNIFLETFSCLNESSKEVEINLDGKKWVIDLKFSKINKEEALTLIDIIKEDAESIFDTIAQKCSEEVKKNKNLQKLLTEEDSLNDIKMINNGLLANTTNSR